MNEHVPMQTCLGSSYPRPLHPAASRPLHLLSFSENHPICYIGNIKFPFPVAFVLHSTSGAGGLLSSVSPARRALCLAQTSDSHALLGLEDGSVALWDVRMSGLAGGIPRAHASRVRGIVPLVPAGKYKQHETRFALTHLLAAGQAARLMLCRTY